MRLFDLIRDVDVTGTSGTGIVAQGVEFDDLTCAMRWMTPLRSTTLFDDVATLEAIHGHDGLTRIAWWDERTEDKGGGATCPDCGNPVRFCDCPDRQVDKRDSVTDGPTVERSDHARWVKGDKVAGSGRLPDYVDRAGVVTEVVSAIPDLVGYYVLWDGETGRRGPYDPVELADPE